jgi:hypothetical protein
MTDFICRFSIIRAAPQAIMSMLSIRLVRHIAETFHNSNKRRSRNKNLLWNKVISYVLNPCTPRPNSFQIV